MAELDKLAGAVKQTLRDSSRALVFDDKDAILYSSFEASGLVLDVLSFTHAHCTSQLFGLRLLPDTAGAGKLEGAITAEEHFRR